MKDSFFYQIWAVIRSFAAAAIWFVFGQNNSPSELIKRLLIKGFAKAFNINVFVETGTYLGDTVGFLSRQFREIHSIELSHEFVLTVRKRFSSRKNIEIYEGNSADVLPKIVKSINEPTLFWLDAHYSGGNTAGSDDKLPLLKEIGVIVSSWKSGSVILIDDARLLGVRKGYPDFEKIKQITSQNEQNLVLTRKNDIIRIYDSYNENKGKKITL